MVASKCCRRALLTFALATAAGRAQERAEVTFLLSSGNLMGEDAPAAAPWETLEGFRSGRDTRARLTLGNEQAGAFPGVSTGALLRLDAALSSVGEESEVRLRDGSSWLALVFRPSPDLELRLRAYPLDTDYVRLGHAHALDWGGTDVSRRESVFLRQKGGVPGAELGLSLSRVRLFTWLKSAQLEDAARGPERAWGGAVGGSFEPSRQWRIDVGFGFFQRPPTFVEGASVRLVWRHGVVEPELAPEPFRPAPFRAAPERFSAESRSGFALALEGVTLLTRQRRYEAPTLATSTLAPAAALYGSLRTRRWGGHFLLSWRSLPFLLKSDPRVSPEQALPAAAPSQPELGAWLGVSFEALTDRLVPSLELGARLPAALVTPSGYAGVGQTFVAAGPAGFEALAPGVARAPLWAGRLSVRLQASAGLSLVLSSEYQRDPNRSAFVPSPSGIIKRPAPGQSLTLLVAAQARF
jgi:hypothetical protein